MNIFLSWSGERSKKMADALELWLPLVLYYVNPWSSKKIPAGQRWFSEVGNELEKADFGIICLTKDNLEAPWIMFEAGAISKEVSISSVCPYLLDVEISDIAGKSPLGQFQAKKTDKDSTFELLQSINEKAPEPRDSRTLERAFDGLWPQLAQQLKTSAGDPKQTRHRVRPQPEILEDLVQTVMAVNQRIDQLETPTKAEILEDLLENVRTVDQRLNQLETTVALNVRSWSRGKPTLNKVYVGIVAEHKVEDRFHGEVIGIWPSGDRPFTHDVAEAINLSPDDFFNGDVYLWDPQTMETLTEEDSADISAYRFRTSIIPFLLLQEPPQVAW
jgi:hypothetical protein